MPPDSRDSYTYPGAPPPYSNDLAPMLEPAGSRESRSPAFLVPTLYQNLSPPSLQKPIAIPATSSKLGSPFLRAFPLVLERYGLPRETFLKFLDDLNRATVASPPVKVLGLAGSMVSMVPLQTTQIIGSSVSVASDLATFAMSKSRSELCISKANQELFAPRGLRVEIAKLDAVARCAQMPILDSDGKIDKNASILSPLEDALEQTSMTAQQRRLQALEPWIEQLDFTPLPVHVPDNFMSKMHASTSERQRKKEEEKMAKNRVKAHEDWSKDLQKAEEDYEKDMRKLEKKTIKAQKKHTKDEQKLEKKLGKLEQRKERYEEDYQKDIAKAHRDWRKDDKEEKSVRKVLWILIRSLDNIST